MTQLRPYFDGGSVYSWAPKPGNKIRGTYMLQLIRLDGLDVWLVIMESDGTIMRGTLDDAVDTLELLGVNPKEVDIAFETMRQYRHNRAHFGINKTFLYSEIMKVQEAA